MLVESSSSSDVSAVQVSMLSRVHHRNLVALIGYCHEAKERVVVYEYMPKGSLSDHLHGRCLWFHK